MGLLQPAVIHAPEAESRPLLVHAITLMLRLRPPRGAAHVDCATIYQQHTLTKNLGVLTVARLHANASASSLQRASFRGWHRALVHASHYRCLYTLVD